MTHVPRLATELLIGCAIVVAPLGCAGEDEATELVVEVIDGSGGALRIPEELDAFEIRVSSVFGGADDARELVRFRRTWKLGGADGRTLPQTLAVVPASTGSGTVRVDVYGLKNGRVMQRISRTASFGIGMVELPPFALTPLCFGVVCPDGQTCESDGVCRDRVTRDGGVGDDAGVCGPDLLDCGGSCIPWDDDNCGGCGVACPAGERCISNTCACGVGLARCGGACVDLQTDLDHCGACGSPCALPHATTACHAGSCGITSCVAGWADCNGIAADGCEADLQNDISSCGACGRRCFASGASALCIAGVCRVGSCDSGLSDCDGISSNGCETDTSRDVDHCGSCGNACVYTHASASCRFGSCRMGACASGFEDCDGSPSNGCEEPISCVDGSSCTTSCGSTGTRSCATPCAPTCTPPAETCNAADDDCDGACDDLTGCRVPVHRGYGGGFHIYSTNLSLVTSTGLEVENFFWVYESNPGGFSRLYRCSKSGGGSFLTRSSACEGAGSVLETLGWVASGTTCGAVPLYRLYKDGDHFYTPSAAERDNAVSAYGYTYESIVGYVFGGASG